MYECGDNWQLFIGDCRDSMRMMAAMGMKAQMCVTSPPYYGLRDYGHDGQIGLEQTPEEYIAAMVEVFRCVRDVLADDGTLWLNIGDSFGKGKQLLGIPWRVALALQADGWILRQDIIWHKTRVMPSSAKDRCTTNHEYLFLFAKQESYYFDADSIRTPITEVSQKRIKSSWSSKKANLSAKSDDGVSVAVMGNRFAPEKGANKRSVWSVCPSNSRGEHIAMFPPALIEPCILAGSRLGDTILDPFGGSGTTAQVALQHGRHVTLCELNPDYKPLIIQRINK